MKLLQISGIQIVFSYITVITKKLGIGNEFVMTIGICLVELFGVVVSFGIVNRYGRRPLLMSTGAIMGVFLIIMGLLGVGNYVNEDMSHVYNKVVIAMYFLFTCEWYVGDVDDAHSRIQSRLIWLGVRSPGSAPVSCLEVAARTRL